jgi:hypothetical protein
LEIFYNPYKTYQFVKGLNMSYICKIINDFNNIEFLVKEFITQKKTALMLNKLALKQFELKNQNY